MYFDISSQSLIRFLLSILFMISSFPISAGEVVKVNTDKKKLKGSGATAGQIIMANSVDDKIKAEWTDLNVTNAQLAADAVSTSKILNSTIAGDDIAEDTITARSIANGTMPSTLVVDTNGNGHFTSIQDAINALPSTGGKIFINAGVYSETCTIFQSNVILEGCGPASIITSSLAEDTLLLNGQNITLRDLFIQSDNDTAIELAGGADYSKILNCTISGGDGGIIVSQADYVQIIGNRITSTIEESTVIRVAPANDLLIQGNSIQTPNGALNSKGIDVSYNSLRCRIFGNNINMGSDLGIDLQGLIVSASTYSCVIGNTLVGDGSGGGIFSLQSNVVISGNFIDTGAGSTSIFIGTDAFKNAVTGNIATGGISTDATTGNAHTFFGNIAQSISIDVDDSTTQPGNASDDTHNDPDQMNVDF